MVSPLGSGDPRTLGRLPGQEQPAANALRKQEKSATFRIGAVVEPSQLA
jgi:hypothetical protein